MTNDERPEYVKDAVGKVTLAAVNTRLAIEIAKAHVAMLIVSPPHSQRAWEEHMQELHLELSVDPTGDSARNGYGMSVDKVKKPPRPPGTKSERAIIREWAIDKGYPVQDRGALPKRIIEEYYEENPLALGAAPDPDPEE